MVWNSETDRVDWKMIRQLESLRQALPELVEIFKADCPRRLNSLREALKSENLSSSLALVHEITSASAYLGGLGIKQKGLEIRACVEHRDWSRAQVTAQELEAECEFLIASLSSRTF
ncbi:MAG: Hpt domain-containing protein [Bdellovibrionales bacterium]